METAPSDDEAQSVTVAPPDIVVLNEQMAAMPHQCVQPNEQANVLPTPLRVAPLSRLLEKSRYDPVLIYDICLGFSDGFHIPFQVDQFQQTTFTLTEYLYYNRHDP